MEPLLGGHSDRHAAKSTTTTVAAVFTLAATVLFIVALSTTALITTTGFGPVKTDKLSGDFGPFRVCYRVGDSQDCEGIDGDCEFEMRLLDTSMVKGLPLGASITQQIPVVDNCGAWNAARGFLVLAALCSLAAFVVLLTIACTGSSSGVARFMATGLAMAAAISGIITMSILIDRKGHDDAFTTANSASFGYGFGLLTGGWVLCFIAAIPSALSK